MSSNLMTSIVNNVTGSNLCGQVDIQKFLLRSDLQYVLCLQEQGPRKEPLAYIELASMNCGILMEAKNDNSKSTYLTDPDVEVYIPVSGHGIMGTIICDHNYLNMKTPWCFHIIVTSIV